MDTFKTWFLIAKLAKKLDHEGLVMLNMLIDEIKDTQVPEGLKDAYENERWAV